MAHLHDRLTERERELLRLLAQGHTAKTIANRHGLSESAVNERLRVARRKTNARSSRELARSFVAHEEDARKSSDEFLGIEPLPIFEHPSPRRAFRTGLHARLNWQGVTMIGVILSATALAVFTSVPEAPASPGPNWAVVVIQRDQGRLIALDWKSIQRQGSSVAFTAAEVRRETDGRFSYSITSEQIDCESFVLPPPLSVSQTTPDVSIARVACGRDLTLAVGPLAPEITLESLARGLLRQP